MWIKENCDKICIEDYNSIRKDQRNKNTAFYNKLVVQFDYQNILCFQRKQITTILFFKVLIKRILILFKCSMVSNQIKVHNDIYKYEKTVETGFSNIDEDMKYVRYYKRNTQSSFNLNCDSKYMDPIFWCSSASYITKDTKFIKLCIQLINRQS